MSDDLVATARRLATMGRSKPRQSYLKRAVSTAYYALFHAVARSSADCFVGSGQARSEKAWLQTYRALDHGPARQACVQLRGLGFPSDLIQFADAFVALQDARHTADYDPTHRVSRNDTIAAINLAEIGIAALRTGSKSERTALAAQLLFRRRPG